MDLSPPLMVEVWLKDRKMKGAREREEREKQMDKESFLSISL